LVLTNGSIVNVSYLTHPDLFWALRGGGSNFGIVTRFDLETHPMEPMWGGWGIGLISDIDDRLSRLGVLREFSWSPMHLVGQGMGLVRRALCLVGLCTTLDIFTTSLHNYSMEAALDPHAHAYNVLIMVPHISSYLVFNQLNHAKGLDSSPSLKSVQAQKRIYRRMSLSTATKIGQDLTDYTERGSR
jgi:hypothetical protein